jgi:FKBP-type peptidyl-prolyl cis-trans isomerase FkpA
MRKPHVIASLILVASAAFAQDPTASIGAAPPLPPVALTAEDEREVLRTLGAMLWRNLQSFDLSPAEIELVQQGLADAAAGKLGEPDLATMSPKIDSFRRTRIEKRAATEKERGRVFVEEQAARPGAVRTESGLVYLETAPGSGDSPTPEDTVKVHYRGTLVDGTEFDSSFKREQPAEFPLGRVVKCWTEGLQKMKPGGKATLVCPSDIAYGDRGRPSIPPGATLVFEVELLEVKKKPVATGPTPVPTPENKPAG